MENVSSVVGIGHDGELWFGISEEEDERVLAELVRRLSELT